MADANVTYKVQQVGAAQVAAGFQKVDGAIVQTGNTMKNKLIPNTRVSNMGLMNMGRIAQDMPFGLMGISNNLTFMAEQMGRAKQQGFSFTAQLKGMAKQLWGVGGLTFAFSAFTSVLLMAQMGMFSSKKAVENLTESLKKLWSTTFKSAEAFKKFAEDVEKFTSSQIRESIRAIKAEIIELGIGLEAFGTTGFQKGMGWLIQQFKDEFSPAADKVKELNKQLAILLGLSGMGSGQAGNTGNPSVPVIEAMAAGVKLLGKEVKVVVESLNSIGRTGEAGSFRNRGGGARTQGFLMENVFQPAKPKLLKDAKKIGDTIFDDWSNVLVSNMNTAWATIFGEANSLFEQLVNSMVDMLIKDLFVNLLTWLPSGGVFGFLAKVIPTSPGGGGQTNITIEMGGMPLGQVVLEGNRQISQRRMV